MSTISDRIKPTTVSGIPLLASCPTILLIRHLFQAFGPSLEGSDLNVKGVVSLPNHVFMASLGNSIRKMPINPVISKSFEPSSEV